MKLQIKIEDGIPIPPSPKDKFDYSECAKVEIGQSFIMEGTRGKAMGRVMKLKKRFPDRKFITRFIEEKMRVWRVE